MSEREREGEEALGRAMLSLEGLSCGDAFGERFFPRRQHLQRVRERRLPEATWVFTDDTMMAISVVEMLRRDGRIVEERLAEHFAELYDQRRGYGEAMHGLMRGLKERGGGAWREEAGALFGGEGSFGNGSAMRVAPLGAYFADDLDRLVEEARRSAVTTHSHAEAVAGAVGVAMGAAVAWRWRERGGWTTGEFLEEVRQRVPESVVREGIGRAMELPDGVGAPRAAEGGCGQGVRELGPRCLGLSERPPPGFSGEDGGGSGSCEELTAGPIWGGDHQVAVRLNVVLPMVRHGARRGGPRTGYAECDAEFLARAGLRDDAGCRAARGAARSR